MSINNPNPAQDVAIAQRREDVATDADIRLAKAWIEVIKNPTADERNMLEMIGRLILRIEAEGECHDTLEYKLALAERERDEARREIKDHAEWAKNAADPNHPDHIPLAKKVADMTAKIAALESKLAVYESGAALSQSTEDIESARECADEIMLTCLYDKDGGGYLDLEGTTKIIAAHTAKQTEKWRECLSEARDEVVELANYHAVYDKHRPDREASCHALVAKIDAQLAAVKGEDTTGAGWSMSEEGIENGTK